MTANRYRNGPRGPYNPYAREYKGAGIKAAQVITALFILMIVIGTMVLLSKPANPQPAPPSPDRMYSVSLTAAELRVIGDALSERPYREVANLIAKLRQQMTQQQTNVPQPKSK